MMDRPGFASYLPQSLTFKGEDLWRTVKSEIARFTVLPSGDTMLCTFGGKGHGEKKESRHASGR